MGPGRGHAEADPFGQQILDTVLARVEEACGHGFIGWSIGKTPAVVRSVAQKLSKPVRSVAGGLADLIEKGYFGNQGVTDGLGPDAGYAVTGCVFVYHHAWLAYSGFNKRKAAKDQGKPTYEHWLEWDGVGGTSIPYDYPIP